MRYPACEKLEIIQLVEHSHLPVRRTLVKLGMVGTRQWTRWRLAAGRRVVLKARMRMRACKSSLIHRALMSANCQRRRPTLGRGGACFSRSPISFSYR
jgi:hypothetical protein